MPFWLAALLGAVVGTNLSLGYIEREDLAQFFTPSTDSDMHLLGLRAIQHGRQTTVSWNPKAVNAQNAKTAVLSIQDGSLQGTVRLAPADITHGSVEYLAVSDQVAFSLRVVDLQGRNLSESLIALGSPALSAKLNLPAEHRTRPARNF